MRYDMEKAEWLAEEKREFRGWDFSSLDGRWESAPLPWSYAEMIHQYLKPIDDLLDMGTGGGEFLLTLGHPAEKTSVTEAWPPNVALLRERLAPMGIRVYEVEDGENASLPIEDNSFDVVINRHESYTLSEVKRVLRPGGYFITQQVGGENVYEFVQRIVPGYSPPYAGFSPASELPKFTANGFTVLRSEECFVTLRFFDVGAFVYWAKVLPWVFPGFSVETHFDALCAMREEILRNGFVRGRQHRFLIVAKQERKYAE